MAERALLFMKLTNDKDVAIKGEAEAEGYEGQIELKDWNWRIGREKSAGKTDEKNEAGSGSSKSQELGEVNPEVFSFSKLIDRATTAMLAAMTSGQKLKAEIKLEEQSEADFEMLVKLTGVRITKYELEGEVSDISGELEEKWVFNFNKLEIEYKPAAEKGALSFQVDRDSRLSTEASGAVDTVKMGKDMVKLTEKGTHALADSVFHPKSTTQKKSG